MRGQATSGHGLPLRSRHALRALACAVIVVAMSASGGRAAAQQGSANADSLWRRGDFTGAAKLYAERLEANPADALAKHRLAMLELRAGRWDEAFTMLDDLSRRHPGDADIRVTLARAHAGMGDLDRAIAMVDSILVARPADVGALQARGQFAGRQGRLREAEAWWRRAFDAGPADADSRLGLALTLRQQGRHAAARAILEPALVGPAWDELLEEAARIASVTRPRAGFDVVLEEDSDGNGVGTVVARAATRVAPRVEVRAHGYVRSARFDAGSGTEHTAHAAHVTLWTQREPGWALQIGTGAAASSVADAGTMPTWHAAVSSPGRNAIAGTLSVSRSAFDDTALLMRQRVRLDEWLLDGNWRPLAGWIVTGSIAAASLHGERSGTANRRWRASAEAERVAGSGPVAVALAWRSFGYRDDADDAYFDPDFYGVAEVVGRLRQPSGPWLLQAEVAPGIQRIGARGETSGSLRASGAAAYQFRPGRQLRVSAVYARSGLQQLSAGTGNGYGYAAIGVGLAWWF